MAFVMDDIDEAPAGSRSGSENSDYEEEAFVLEEEMASANNTKRKYVPDFEMPEREEGNIENDFTPNESNQTVPSSLPIAINFGIDPRTNKPRPPPNRREKRSTSPVPHGSIYESMMEISRSMQPEDDRLFGTKPSLEDDRNAKPGARSISNFPQMYLKGGRQQPTTIVYQPMPIPPGTIGEEAGEEFGSQTPK